MLPEALGAPTRSHDAAGTIVVGGLLVLFSVLFPIVWVFSLAVSPIWIILAPLAIFPPLIVLGYDLRVIGAGLREEPATPPFLNWSGLARDGLRSILLGAVYLSPAVVVIVVVALIVAGLQSGQLGWPERVATIATGIATVAASAFVLLYLGIFLYIRPATLVIFAATGRMRAALSPRRVLGVALSGNYAVGWTMAAVVLLIGFAIAAPLQLLLFGFFVAFYVRAVAYYVYGNGARSAVATLEAGTKDAEMEPSERTTSSRKPAMSPASRAETSPDTPAERPSLRPLWSPRIEPEPPAAVQVGRPVRSPEQPASGQATTETEREGDQTQSTNESPHTEEATDEPQVDDR